MSDILGQAKLFFEACETGQGWEVFVKPCPGKTCFENSVRFLNGFFGKLVTGTWQGASLDVRRSRKMLRPLTLTGRGRQTRSSQSS